MLARWWLLRDISAVFLTVIKIEAGACAGQE
jgi:hypothetical protein